MLILFLVADYDGGDNCDGGDNWRCYIMMSLVVVLVVVVMKACVVVGDVFVVDGYNASYDDGVHSW